MTWGYCMLASMLALRLTCLSDLGLTDSGGQVLTAADGQK